MNDFEEIDGKLVYICSHEWDNWYNVWEPHENVMKRNCSKCMETQLLVPKSYGEEPRKKGIVSKILTAIGL